MQHILVAVALAGLVATVSANWCYVCSTRDTVNCLVPDINIMMRECIAAANNFTCYTRIVNREVERGCFSTLSIEDHANCNNLNNCELCHDAVNQGRCNGAVFPEHRLHCHQCTGTTNDTCGLEITTPAQLCRLYDAEDQCFVSVTGDMVQRGCLSESDFCRVGQTCHTCDGNGCNYKHYDSGASSAMIYVKTVVMALLAVLAYSSFKQ
ncbi:uncharacterized protein LOC128741870 [Sabethes cyaneus]|uniref:uncharacterized protein LOC128741870 n=1 Tax=Sabethes cyaneus TaxID=53552 RepID=UPI00237E676D|nr:uncharacterized protein LOC128741870 [Sabethes cyaneus]